MSSKLTEFFSELFCSICVRAYNLKDFLRTCFRYYRNLRFAAIDLRLLVSYFWTSPYYICRTMQNEAYGETPLITMALIAKEVAIKADDIVYELGSGRGRCAFWLAEFIKCQTIGIECNELFVKKADCIRDHFGLVNPRFICQDMLQTDFSNASVIYLYGTLLSDDMIRELCKKFAKLKKGSRIVTISYSLQEYVKTALFEVTKEFEVEFCWGKTTAYLHIITD